MPIVKTKPCIHRPSSRSRRECGRAESWVSTACLKRGLLRRKLDLCPLPLAIPAAALQEESKSIADAGLNNRDTLLVECQVAGAGATTACCSAIGVMGVLVQE